MENQQLSRPFLQKIRVRIIENSSKILIGDLVDQNISKEIALVFLTENLQLGASIKIIFPPQSLETKSISGSVSSVIDMGQKVIKPGNGKLYRALIKITDTKINTT